MVQEEEPTRRPATHPGRKPVVVCGVCGAKYFAAGFNPAGACEHIQALIKEGKAPREEV